MSSIHSLLALSTALAASGPDAQTPGPPSRDAAQPREVERALANGATLVTVPWKDGNWSELVIGVRAGAALDPPDKSGLARVTALVVRENLRRTAILGDRVELATGMGSTVLACGGPRSSFEEALEEIVEAVRAPEVSEEILRRVVEHAIEERRRLREDDRAVGELELVEQLFGSMSTGRSVLGDIRALAALTVEDVRSFHRAHYVGANLVIALGGGFDDALGRKAASLVAELPRGRRSTMSSRPTAPASNGLRIVVVDKPQRTSAQVFFGKKVDTLDARQHLAWAAANASVAGTYSGRLVGALRRRPAAGGLVTSRMIPPSPVRGAGFVEVWAQCPPARVADAVLRLLEALRALAQRGLDADEVDFAKRHLRGRLELEMRDPLAAAFEAVASRMLPFAAPAPAQVDTLSSAEIASALAPLASTEDLVIVVVTSATAELQAALVKVPGVKNVSVVGYDDR